MRSNNNEKIIFKIIIYNNVETTKYKQKKKKKRERSRDSYSQIEFI